MKTITNAIIMITAAMLVALGILAIIVKFDWYQTDHDYILANPGSLSAPYENKYLELIEINPDLDYNVYGQIHISSIIEYKTPDDNTQISEVIRHQDQLLVLKNGDLISQDEVIRRAIMPDDFILQTLNFTRQEKWNFYLLTLLAGLILIYGVSLLVIKNKPIKNHVVKESINQTSQFKQEYSEVDQIVVDYMALNQIKLSSQSFQTKANSMTSKQLISYIESKGDVEQTPGVGRKPTSFKIKNKKAFALVYQASPAVKVTFKSSPLLGEELISQSKGLITKSSFPHGSVWFTIANTSDMTKESLKQLIDIAYELAYHQI